MRRSFFVFCFTLSCSLACTTVYQAQRPVSPNLEKAGDFQVDLDSAFQASAFYALTDTVSIGGTGRHLDIQGSSQADPNDSPQSFIRGGSLNLGYHRRFKGLSSLKYGVLGGLGFESWTGQNVEEEYDAEVDEYFTYDIQSFKMMLAVPYTQFFLSYGGRYTLFQLNTRVSYIQPFSQQLGNNLVFDESLIVEASALGQVSLYDRLSVFFQASLHMETINQETNSYMVIPLMLYGGLSYSFGSDGSLDRVFNPISDKEPSPSSSLIEINDELISEHN